MAGETLEKANKGDMISGENWFERLVLKLGPTTFLGILTAMLIGASVSLPALASMNWENNRYKSSVKEYFQKVCEKHGCSEKEMAIHIEDAMAEYKKEQKFFAGNEKRKQIVTRVIKNREHIHKD